MLFNDLLLKRNIDPAGVLAFRHTPTEPRLKEVLPWLAAESPDVFNAYQQTQTPSAERALLEARYAASFIGQESGKAVFVGLYKVGEHRSMTKEQYWKVPAYQEMKKFGMKGFKEDSPRLSVLWFDLEITDFYSEWKGKLIVHWPPPPIAWVRWTHKNKFAIHAILEESVLVEEAPGWQNIVWPKAKLGVIPTRWREALKHLRGIYYIFDRSDGKGYVGAAYGRENILGRWEQYSATGHGKNMLLRERVPDNFEFSILEIVSPTMLAEDVQALETTWKNQLHSRYPFGLNDN